MAKTLRLAVAQMESVPGEVQANLETVSDFVGRAEREGADLVLFPELCLSGYPVGDWCPDATLRPDGPEIDRLRKLSTRVPMVVGLIEETEDAEFFNSALYLAGGEVRHVHRKIYLPHYRHFDERRHFMSGWWMQSIDVPWCRMAILICGDSWHLSLPYMAASDGADLLLILAASSREGLTPSIDCQSAWTRLNQTYALTLSMFVAFANHAGSSGGLHFYGGSHVVLPDGNLLASAGTDRPELLIAELDLGLLRRQRLILPFRRDDSLALTLNLGKQVLQRRNRRRRGFLQLAGRPEGTPSAPAEDNPPVQEAPDRA